MRRTNTQMILLPILEILFAVLVILFFTRIIPVPDLVLVAIIIAFLFSIHYTGSLLFCRQGRGRWQDLRIALGYTQVDETRRRRLFGLHRLRLRLPVLAGTHDGRPVRLEAQHTPFLLSASYFIVLWFLKKQIYATVIRVESDQGDEGFEMKLEPRRAVEKTDTRVSDGQGEGRTPFEREHHLFTSDPTKARGLLDAGTQDRIMDLEGFQRLQVEGKQLVLEFAGIATDPTQMKRGLDLVTGLSNNLPRDPYADPQGPRRDPSTTPLPG